MVKGQRLLAIHVLARLHGVDRGQRVPVIRDGDQYGVDVAAIAQVAEVFVDIDSRAAAVQDVERGLIAMVAIDVAHRGHLHALVGNQVVGQVMPPAEITDANRTDNTRSLEPVPPAWRRRLMAQSWERPARRPRSSLRMCERVGARRSVTARDSWCAS